jgi:hypothetical protein
MGTSLVLLVYAEGRRLLHAAVDDRYGELVRFWRQAGFGSRVNYAVSFFFCHGVRDLMRLGTLLAFDLFVVFAFLAPFWRYLFFDDWNPILAASVAVAGIAVFLAWKLWRGMELCRLHGWSQDTWQCERCGEFHLYAEERTSSQKAPKGALKITPQPHGWIAGLTEHLSWHRFWEERLERLASSQEPGNPRPAG